MTTQSSPPGRVQCAVQCSMHARPSADGDARATETGKGTKPLYGTAESLLHAAAAVSIQAGKLPAGVSRSRPGPADNLLQRCSTANSYRRRCIPLSPYGICDNCRGTRNLPARETQAWHDGPSSPPEKKRKKKEMKKGESHNPAVPCRGVRFVRLQTNALLDLVGGRVLADAPLRRDTIQGLETPGSLVQSIYLSLSLPHLSGLGLLRRTIAGNFFFSFLHSQLSGPSHPASV